MTYHFRIFMGGYINHQSIWMVYEVYDIALLRLFFGTVTNLG